MRDRERAHAYLDSIKSFLECKISFVFGIRDGESERKREMEMEAKEK